MFAGTVQLKLPDVAPTVGFAAHARSGYDIAPSRLKSIHPHKKAVSSTFDSATVTLYVLPTLATLKLFQDATPSSVAGIAAPAATASAFVVPYKVVRLSAVMTDPIRRFPTTWLATGESYPIGN